MIDKHFKINTLLSYFSHAIVMGSGFVLMFLINRYAGVEVYGELAIIVSTAGMLTSLLTARSGEAVTRFFVREKTLHNSVNAKLVVLMGISIDFFLALVVFVLFFILSSIIAKELLGSLEFSFIVSMYGFVTFFIFSRGSMIGYFQAHENFKILNSIKVLESILKMLFVIGSFFILDSRSLNFIIYSYILAAFFVSLYLFIIFFIAFRKEFQGVFFVINKSLIKEYLLFNSKTFLSTTLKAGNNNIDNLILGYFTDTKTVGIYQTLKNILTPISFIAMPFNMMTTTKLTQLYEKKEYQKFKQFIDLITSKILKTAILIAVVLYFVLPYILDILNIEVEVTILFGLLIVYFLLNLSMWWSRIFATIVDPMISVYGSTYMLIHNVVLTTSLTFLYGAIGLVSSGILNILVMKLYFRYKLGKIDERKI